MSTYRATRSSTTFDAFRSSFTSADGTPVSAVLPEEKIQQIAEEEGVCFGTQSNSVYTPALVVWIFVTQCLSSSESCVAAVARFLVLRLSLCLEECSAGTGAYCKARAKLSEPFLKRLTLEVGREVEEQALEAWRWKGKRVLLVDGTECTMPDTPANQGTYPQPSSQKPGLGFPMMRLVVLQTLATGVLIDAAMGPYQGKESGETSLFRSLLENCKPGDVIVADRYYCTYWLVALLRARGVDVVFRMHARRKYDFRRGKRLGKKDHIVTWHRPARPEWMDEATYQTMPEQLSMREVGITIDTPGCRSETVVIATTLLDATAYPKEEIADLYGSRWHVELDIRNIKQTLGMDILRCKTPEMVRKEIWAHLLGYNLVRQAMVQAALAGELDPREISFAGAVQTLNAFRETLMRSSGEQRGEVVRAVLKAIASHKVGDRPGRIEPRKVKRRPKPYARMTEPRAVERVRCIG